MLKQLYKIKHEKRDLNKRRNLMDMHRATQCKDDRTGEIGSFGFTHGRRTNTGHVIYHSLTPVFDNLIELFVYCDENDVTLVQHIPILETGTNKPL